MYDYQEKCRDRFKILYNYLFKDIFNDRSDKNNLIICFWSDLNLVNLFYSTKSDINKSLACKLIQVDVVPLVSSILYLTNESHSSLVRKTIAFVKTCFLISDNVVSAESIPIITIQQSDLRIICDCVFYYRIKNALSRINVIIKGTSWEGFPL